MLTRILALMVAVVVAVGGYHALERVPQRLSDLWRRETATAMLEGGCRFLEGAGWYDVVYSPQRCIASPALMIDQRMPRIDIIFPFCSPYHERDLQCRQFTNVDYNTAEICSERSVHQLPCIGAWNALIDACMD